MLNPFKKYTVDCLKSSTKLDIAKRRSYIEVLVIDDTSFPPKENLEKNGFRITQWNDIEDLKTIEHYDLILCDIEGVGKKINPEDQGGAVIKQMKMLYPYKYIIAYSARTFGTQFNQFFMYADETVPKDKDISDWCDTLDAGMEDLVDPQKSWIRIRKYLSNSTIGTKDLLNLEDKYVRSILGKHNYFDDLDLNHISIDASSIVNGLVSSVLFKLVFEGIIGF
jgi:hypothetical protein